MPTNPPVSVAAIARGLSEAQREWFRNCTVTADGRGLGKVAHFSLPDGTVRYYSAMLDALTPLGLALKAHLLAPEDTTNEGDGL